MTDDKLKTLKELPNTMYGSAVLEYLKEAEEDYGDITKATTEDFKGKQFVVEFIRKFRRTCNLEKPKVVKHDYQ